MFDGAKYGAWDEYWTYSNPKFNNLETTTEEEWGSAEKDLLLWLVVVVFLVSSYSNDV